MYGNAVRKKLKEEIIMNFKNSAKCGGCSITIGGGFATTLGLIFIILKLTGVIEWSWIWVLAPFWISMLLTILIVAIVILIITLLNKK